MESMIVGLLLLVVVIIVLVFKILSKNYEISELEELLMTKVSQHNQLKIDTSLLQLRYDQRGNEIFEMKQLYWVDGVKPKVKWSDDLQAWVEVK